jgi:hypothetical protein
MTIDDTNIEFKIDYMESGAPSGKSANEPTHRWGNIWGTGIAIVTLILPIAAIANYSANNVPVSPKPQLMKIHHRW